MITWTFPNTNSTESVDPSSYKTKWLGDEGKFLVVQEGESYMSFARSRSSRVLYTLSPEGGFETLTDAKEACERYKCRYTSTDATADTQSKSCSQSPPNLASALLAASRKGCDGKSAKSESPNLEALMSRRPPGVSSAVGDINMARLDYMTYKGLASKLLGTMAGIPQVLSQIGVTSYDLDQVEDALKYCGVGRCLLCHYWCQPDQMAGVGAFKSVCSTCKQTISEV